MRKRALQISGSRSTILLDGVLRYLDAVAELDVAGGGHAGRQAVDVDEAVGGLLVEARTLMTPFFLRTTAFMMYSFCLFGCLVTYSIAGGPRHHGR